MKRRQVLSTLALAAVAGAVGAAPAATASTTAFPDRIALPDDFRPEGVTIRGTTFHVTSLKDGAVYRGDLLTGNGAVLIPGRADGISVGVHIDQHNRLWVCGGFHGEASVYDAKTGVKLATYRFTDDTDNTFVNDCVITRDAVYFTDSGRPYVYVVPLGAGGGLPAPGAFRTLALTGELADPAAFANGIEVAPDGTLIIVGMASTKLYTVDPRTGASRAIDTGGATFGRGDGLVLRGLRLYVCRNATVNKIDVVDLDPCLTRGRLRRTITDPRFDSPSTIAAFGPYLYAVNARFTIETPAPTDKYDLLRVTV